MVEVYPRLNSHRVCFPKATEIAVYCLPIPGNTTSSIILVVGGLSGWPRDRPRTFLIVNRVRGIWDVLLPG